MTTMTDWTSNVEKIDPAKERWWLLYKPDKIRCGAPGCQNPATAIYAGYGIEWRGIAACAEPTHRARALNSTACPECGRDPAAGMATINEQRYCHGDDDPTPTCYTRACWKMHK
jgi:hypothetical protein